MFFLIDFQIESTSTLDTAVKPEHISMERLRAVLTHNRVLLSEDENILFVTDEGFTSGLHTQQLKEMNYK